ncbi:MAG: multiple sugar transport system permease protein [Nocardioidaceae bacterium]|jgi:multiple sugar transport system permease protein|nr:multiple sugar transport system permease protein [Nocardioidaceae bacterium]
MATSAAPARKALRGRNKRSILSRMRQDASAYLFIAPGFIIFSVFTVAALIFAFYLTFHEWSIISPDKPFVGLDNYRHMLKDPDFRTAVFNTAYFTLGSVPLSMAIGLLLALLLNQPLKFLGLFRTMYFLPVVTPFVVTALLWKWLYNGEFGLFNYYLLKTHLIDQPLLWLSSQNLAMPAVILMSVWGGVGFSMVIYLAGLQAIPEELYESAKLDGAGPLARLWYITIPMLAPTTLFLLVIGVISSFQIFTQIYIMTSGGPLNRTTTIVYYIYEWGFKFYDLGYASTLGMGLFVLLLGVTILQLRLYRRADI